MAETPAPMVTVESLRDHTNDDGTWHVAGTTYEVPAEQVDSLRAQLMAVTPEVAQTYRDQLQANEDWYANQPGTAPAPVLTSLVPPTVALGAPSFTIHVHGIGFAPGAVIVWNGYDEPTTVVSSTEVTTGVNMAVWAAPATVPVLVRNPDGRLSNALSFTFTQPAADPAATRRR